MNSIVSFHRDIEGQRIASRIGAGGLAIIDSSLATKENTLQKAEQLFTQMERAHKTDDTIHIAYNNKTGWATNLYQFKTHKGTEHEAYFYHPDHLGSSNWITDANGEPYQLLQYMAFGEEYVDIKLGAWSASHRFSGKEKDSESNYSYFGSRYYNSELSIWLSVDPMSDKYPSLSPFAYCANNPLILIDPNGEDIELTFYTSNCAHTKDEFTKIVNQGLGGQFEADYKQTGDGKYMLDLKATKDGGNVSKLSTEQKAFYNELKGMIDDHSTTAKVAVKGGKTDVAIGNFATNTIDICDINQFDNMGQGAATKQGKLIHELSEQFGKAKGMGRDAAHEKGKAAENRVNGTTRKDVSYNRGVYTSSYTDKKGNTTMYSYDTNETKRKTRVGDTFR